MADISQIKLPNGTTYDIKDTNARERIEVLESSTPSGGGEMIYYVSARRNNPTPKPIDFVYPGDIDLEFYLLSQRWTDVSADMQALFPSVDLTAVYYYKQKKMTNSSGTYLYKMARWESGNDSDYIEFRKIANFGWQVRDMSVSIGTLTTSTWAMSSNAHLASYIKAVYGKGNRLTGRLTITNSGMSDVVPVTGIIRSETSFEFQTYVKHRSDSKMYLINATYSSGTWTVTKVEVGTLA